MDTPDLEMVINEEYNSSKDLKTRKENWILCDLCLGKVAGVLCDKTAPCSGNGSDASVCLDM